jgi:hypothetical protein
MKKILYTLLSGLLIGLAGCFDVKDEIWLDDKGSGNFQSTFDMSGMKDMISMLKTMMPDSLKSETDNNDLLNLEDSVMSMWKGIEQIPGISQVKREKKGDMIFTVSFRFADIQALNAAMASREKKDSGDTRPRGNMFGFSRGQLTCNDTSFAGLNDAMKGMNEGANASDSAAAGMAMLKAFMGDMKYSHIYHLPAKVQSVSNPNAKISPDGKTVTVEINLTSGDSTQTLKNVVRFK